MKFRTLFKMAAAVSIMVLAGFAAAAPAPQYKTLVDDAKYELKDILPGVCYKTVLPLEDDIEFELENGKDTSKVWQIEKYNASICRIKMENDYEGVRPFRKNYAEIEIEGRRRGKCDVVFVHPTGKRFIVKLEVR